MKFTWKDALLIVLLIIVIALAFLLFIFLKKNKPIELGLDIRPKESVTSKNTTFTSKPIGLEFSYPSEWKVTSFSGSDELGNDKLNSFNLEGPRPGDRISIDTFQKQQTLPQHIETLSGYIKANFDSSAPQSIKTDKYNIDGKKGYVVDTFGGDVLVNTHRQIFVDSETYRFRITYDFPAIITNPKYQSDPTFTSQKASYDDIQSIISSVKIAAGIPAQYAKQFYVNATDGYYVEIPSQYSERITAKQYQVEDRTISIHGFYFPVGENTYDDKDSELLAGSSLNEASINVIKDPRSCESVRAAAYNGIPFQSDDIVHYNDLTFNHRQGYYEEEGFQHYVSEFVTQKNDNCYRLTLIADYNDPRNVTDSAQAYNLKMRNSEVQNILSARMFEFVNSFHFNQ